MIPFSLEPRTRKYVRGYEFLSFLSNVYIENIYWILLLKQGLDALKTAFKKVAFKAAESTGE